MSISTGRCASDTGRIRAVMLKGEAVWSFTVMFLQMWSVLTGSLEELKDIPPYSVHSYYTGNLRTTDSCSPTGTRLWTMRRWVRTPT